jgi:hypothetical protein
MARSAKSPKLEELRREVQRETRAAARKATTKRATARVLSQNAWLATVVAALKAFLVIVLPFYAYVRSSVYFQAKGVSPWLAVGLGAGLTMAIVAVYATWVTRRFTGQARARNMARWIALPVVAGWCAYSVVYLAKANAKTDAVRSYYSSVHPVLRAALGTAILVDPDIVLTDAIRVPSDYARMGLPVYDRTLHYKQKTGWVHAVDLRTKGRGPVKNAALQLYFNSMGFRTLRHVGTADHLHVSLPLP